MIFNSQQLSLKTRPTFNAPNTITDLLGDVCNISDQIDKLNDIVQRLQDEIIKIDAFKTELPLTVLFVNDGWCFFVIGMFWPSCILLCFCYLWISVWIGVDVCLTSWKIWVWNVLIVWWMAVFLRIFQSVCVFWMFTIQNEYWNGSRMLGYMISVCACFGLYCLWKSGSW